MNLGKLAEDIRDSLYIGYKLTLNGFQWPFKDTAYTAYGELVEGRLVCEISTRYMKGRPALDAVGYLIRMLREPVNFGEYVWDEAVEGEPHPTEPVFYIETLDGREFRWVNATFIACPGDLK